MIIDDKYKSLNSSLSNFLQSPLDSLHAQVIFHETINMALPVADTMPL
jgi:hypothetical protein